MRCLRHITTAVLLGLTLVAAPASAGDLAAAVRVANAVYPEVPQRCGTVRIEYGPLTPPNDTNGMRAEAHEEECMVRIRPGVVENVSDAYVCSLLTHEWGHLAGRRFPENSSDPYHSLDPADNMYGGPLVHHPACGESDEARAARRAREAQARIAAIADRDLRRADIRDELSVLKKRLRAAKAAKRRARGAKRAHYARGIRRLRLKINRVRAEYRSLASTPVL
jgi:hypothetical protein